MIRIADVVDLAVRAGTFPMQVLLLLGLVALSLVIRRLHHENKIIARDFMLTMENERAVMSKERLERITMLMELIRVDSDMKAKLVCAIENNTQVIRDLKHYAAPKR